MAARECKHLERDPNWRKPPYCIKLKMDEPWKYCRRCMFYEAVLEPEPEVKADQEEREKAMKALEEANAKRKAAWRRYLKFQGPDWKKVLAEAIKAENEYINLASKYGQMVV